jgi:class 3 adenylate cyclase/tetratricopeptide (TPR) repeat protein
MQCPKCQFENPEGSKFCLDCGQKFQLRCPHCDKALPVSAKFCNDCGNDLTKPIETVPIDYSEPQSYTPKHLTDKILTNRSSIVGERKLVTVLFADVTNYTAMAEKLDPEEVHQIMDSCFKILMDEIHKYEGTINQFTGDGVMALFGAPVAYEDHAQRACYVALSIQKSIINFEEIVKKDYNIEFKMRIGINSGLVVVGSIGDDLRMDYTAIGDTTNLAARMESTATPGTILVSRHTYKLTKDFFEYKSLGKIEVKGKKEPQEVFELIKMGEIGTRIGASVAKGLTRFVGRKNSMSALKEAYDKTNSGFGQLVEIVGEAGVGKSRLIHEFKRSLPKDKNAYLEGRCLYHGRSIAYLTIIDIVKKYFDIKESDHESLIKIKMKEKLLQLDNRLNSCLPPLHDLLSLKVEDEVYLQLESQQRREKIFVAVRDLFVRENQKQPLILVVEDLHWIDKTSEQFLEYMIERLANVQILLILLYRHEYKHQWKSKSQYHKIGLDHLTNKSSIELIRAILDDCEIAPEIENIILNRASGNPLFIEELTLNLLENGSIEKHDDQCVLARKGSEIQVPDTVQGIIAARIDRIEENHKRIMQLASVIGREFAYRILQSITGMKEDLKSHLFNLQVLEFIYEKSIFPELEYIFKHALTQEVAYSSLLLKRRKKIHKRIGQAIEEIYTDRLEEFYEILAYHYTKSGHIEKAIHYLKLSGEKSTRNHSLNEAIQFYKQAIEILNKLTESDETQRHKLQVLLSMTIPLRVAGYPQDSLRFLKEGERLANDLEDKKKLTNFYSQIGNLYATRGNTQLAQRYEENCFEQAENNQDVEFMAPIAYDLCNTYIFIGEYGKIIKIAPKVLHLLKITKRKSEFFSRPDNVYSELCGYYGLSLGMQGDFKKGEAFCEKSLKHATEICDLRTMGFCENMYGYIYLIKGDWKLSIEHFQKCIKYFEEAKWLWPLSIACSGLVYSYSFLDDQDNAFKYSEKLHKLKDESQIVLFSSFMYWMLGSAYINLNDLKSAQKYIAEALNLAKRNIEKHGQGLSLIDFGRILAETDSSQIEKAGEYILLGTALLEKLNIVPHYSQGYLYLGQFYANTGRKEKALENLENAEEMFQEMGMDYWLAKTKEFLDKL